MGKLSVRTVLVCLVLFSAAGAGILQPVSADNGTISIAYRGSGGGYIGDTIIFDGKDTYGNKVLVRISGPGLPAEGVPVNNLNGPAGSGTPIEVDRDGSWKFAWYSYVVPGTDKLKTARYTFTVTDSADPARSSTAEFMLKKPEYSITASPNPVNPGHYLELIGNAEEGISDAKIEIRDAAGTVQRTFTSPVSSSGYFNYGFHVDMAPGQYTVTVSNPSLKVPFGTTFSVVPEEGSAAASNATQQETPVPILSSSPAGSDTPAVPAVTETLLPENTSTTPAKSSPSPLTVVIAVAGIILACSRGRQP